MRDAMKPPEEKPTACTRLASRSAPKTPSRPLPISPITALATLASSDSDSHLDAAGGSAWCAGMSHVSYLPESSKRAGCHGEAYGAWSHGPFTEQHMFVSQKRPYVPPVGSRARGATTAYPASSSVRVRLACT